MATFAKQKGHVNILLQHSIPHIQFFSRSHFRVFFYMTKLIWGKKVTPVKLYLTDKNATIHFV